MSAPTTLPAARVAIVTLGCGRNEVDSEQLAGLLGAGGYEVIEEAEEADAVLVNTCTFIAPAQQESVDTILAACDLKRDGNARVVLVVGCMAQRHPDELAAEIPEADAIVGFAAYPRLPALLDDALAGRTLARVIGFEADEETTGVASPAGAGARAPLPRLPLVSVVATPPDGQDLLDRIPESGPRFPVRRRLTVDGVPTPWAYLKIASGCDRTCTFCSIPSFRGRFRSRPLDELVAEAGWLASEGVREVVLVSENTTAWGKDLDGGRDAQPGLLRHLAQVEGIERLRLLYLQPAELTPALTAAMIAEPKVADYFDLSLQHASGEVVRRMARSGDAERFLAMMADIRRDAPDAVFRSNMILGFPGETERDLDVLEDFLVEARIDWLGLFAFSPQDGTAAATLPDQVDPVVAAERVERIRAVQERIADEASRRFVGRELQVLVEVDEDGVTLGRSYREGPDSDGEVRLLGPRGARLTLPSGRMVAATVVESVGVDLVAEVRG